MNNIKSPTPPPMRTRRSGVELKPLLIFSTVAAIVIAIAFLILGAVAPHVRSVEPGIKTMCHNGWQYFSQDMSTNWVLDRDQHGKEIRCK